MTQRRGLIGLDQTIEKLREETENISRLQNYVQEANTIEDLLKNQIPFQKYNSRDLNVRISAYTKCPADYESWMFSLLVNDMKDIWSQAYPWDEVEKRAALFESDSRYLIAVADENPVGFLHFKFEQEDDNFVIVIYNIHIEEPYRRHGLGRFMVRAVEFIGRDLHVDEVLTMVYKANSDGLSFFSQLKYVEHSSSPDKIAPSLAEHHKHTILTHRLHR